MAQQDVLDYIRKTPHNSNVNVVKGMLNFEDGGGGSSDFSTAEVTFISSSDSYSVICSTVNDEYETLGTSDLVVQSGSPMTVTVPLYKGKNVLYTGVFLNIDGPFIPILTGDISLGEGGIEITGDGTVAFAGGRDGR